MAMRLVIVLTLLMSLGAMMSTTGIAQDHTSNDPNLHPELEEEPRVVSGSDSDATMLGPSGPSAAAAWGTSQGATWIGATEFTHTLSAGAPPLVYAGNFFFAPSGSSGRYYAQLQVEPGVSISHLTCSYNDSSSDDNIQFIWYRYTTDFASGSTTAETLDSFVTSGTPGHDYNFLDAGPPVTMTNYNPDTDDLVQHHIAVDVTPNVSFAGCFAFWNRQVAPAPGAASFDDVPTSHPFFQYVEALADSGTTAGCDADSFCPNSSLTRGQMAVFLSKALGMGFQY